MIKAFVVALTFVCCRWGHGKSEEAQCSLLQRVSFIHYFSTNSTFLLFLYNNNIITAILPTIMHYYQSSNIWLLYITRERKKKIIILLCSLIVVYLCDAWVETSEEWGWGDCGCACLLWTGLCSSNAGVLRVWKEIQIMKCMYLLMLYIFIYFAWSYYFFVDFIGSNLAD